MHAADFAVGLENYSLWFIEIPWFIMGNNFVPASTPALVDKTDRCIKLLILYLFYHKDGIRNLIFNVMWVCERKTDRQTPTGLEARHLPQLADTKPFGRSPVAGKENGCQRKARVDDKPFVCKLRLHHQPVQTKQLWNLVDLCVDRKLQACWGEKTIWRVFSTLMCSANGFRIYGRNCPRGTKFYFS